MTLDMPPLPEGRDFCLFLDVDGTLLDIARAPAEVRVDDELRELLRGLERLCEGALAIVSGRAIADIDGLFDPLFFAVAGVHGCERRDASGHWMKPTFDLARFADYRERLRSAVSPLEGVLFEDKHCAVALHYRQAPAHEGPLREILGRAAALLPAGHEMIEGIDVIEIKPSSHDKATAVEAFMQEAPFAGRYPIFIGDDLTDQDAFAAVRRHRGMAIAVGDNVESEWRLADPSGVRSWLASLLKARSQ